MIYSPRIDDAYRLLHDGILALAHAEQAGIRVDTKYVEQKKLMLARKMDKLEEEFKNTKLFRHWEHSSKGKVNINSNVQLGNFLYGTKKIQPTKFTNTGKPSTDEEALQQLNIPELDILLRRGKIKKAWDVLDGFSQEQVNGYVHPFFNLNLVITYRSSSDSPNFQNIPKRDEEMMNICRKALYPRPGHQLLEVDYSGLEVRIAACYHKDSTMLKYINDPKSDMHADMARQIFKLDKYERDKHYTLRQAAKNGFVFPEFYGDYYKNCASNMANGWCKLPTGNWSAGQGIPVEQGTIADHMISRGIKSLRGFERHVQDIENDFWNNRFPEYTEWKDRWWKVYKKYGYIDLLTGFRCSGIMDKKSCINYPIQGAAFHCLLWSFIELDRRARKEAWDTRLIGQIHDSMLLDVHPDELGYVKQVIRQITCKDLPKAWPWIIVPMDVDMEICPVDGSWVEKEHIK